MKAFNLILLILILSCEGYNDRRNEAFSESIDNNEIICLQFLCNGVPCQEALADGQTKVEINAFVPLEITDDKNSIDLSTENGTFSRSNTAQLSSLRAEARDNDLGFNECQAGQERINLATDTLISSTTASKFKVDMTVDEINKEWDFEFIQADIEAITISADRFSVFNSPLSEAVLTARGLRNIGQPSIGQNIVFKLELADGTIITEESKFRNTRNITNEANEATTTFTVGDIDFVGDLFCIACVDEVVFGAICDTVQISVLDE